MKKRILFVSEIAPSNGIASAVLLYRHLKMLEESGCEINVLMYDSQSDDSLPSSWRVKKLPSRKWWYPPYRPHNALKWVRFLVLYLESLRFIRQAKPDLVIGFLHGVYYSGFAAFISKRIGKPLTVFYHDRTEKLLYHKDERMQGVAYKHNAYVINQARKVWTVSPQLTYPEPSWQNKFRVVYPIPEIIQQKAQWKEVFSTRPAIGYAGSLYNEVVDVMIAVGKELDKINGSLIFMTHLSENVKKIQAAVKGVVVVDTRNTAEACQFFAENASAFIVAYPEQMEIMPWIDSCFPSKFTQFVQTGLPLLVLAPKEAAISKWCVNNDWIGYSDDYQHLEGLLEKIVVQDSWQAMADQSVHATRNDFDQRKIQALVEEDIESII
jgi:hypothetical protein